MIYLDDEENDGILRVPMCRIAMFENTALYINSKKVFLCCLISRWRSLSDRPSFVVKISHQVGSNGKSRKEKAH